MTRNQIIIGSVIGSILLLAIVFTVVGKTYLSNPSTIIKSFEKAIVNGDTDKLLNIVSSEEITVTKENISSMMNYLKENSTTELQSLISIMKVQADSFKKDDIEDSYFDDNIIFLKRVPGKLGSKSYKIGLRASNIILTVPVEGAKIFINDEEFTEDLIGTNEIGPFLPGIYEITAKYDGLSPLNDKVSVNLIKDSLFGNSVSVFSESYNLNVKSNKTGYNLFINGKDFGKIDDLSTKIGPLTGDSEIYGVLKDGETEIKTEVQKVTKKDKNKDITLEFQNEEEKATELEESTKTLIDNYTKALVEAINNNDFKKISSYLTEDGKIAKDYPDLLKEISEKELKIELLKVEISEFNLDTEKNIATIKSSESYKITNKDESTSEENAQNTYSLQFNPESKEFKLIEVTKA